MIHALPSCTCNTDDDGDLSLGIVGPCPRCDLVSDQQHELYELSTTAIQRAVLDQRAVIGPVTEFGHLEFDQRPMWPNDVSHAAAAKARDRLYIASVL